MYVHVHPNMLTGKYLRLQIVVFPQSIVLIEVALVYKKFIIHGKKPEAIVTVLPCLIHTYIHSNCLSGVWTGSFCNLNS